MRFEDASGLVECVGDTFATSTSSDGLSVNKAQGERIVLHLAPKSANGADRRDDDVPSKAGDITIHRRVRLAEIFGKPGAPGGLDPEPAKVEYRHYDQPSAAGAERRLNRLRYVEGMIISADMQADTFTVPTAGRALMVDQAEKSSSPSVAQDKSPVLFPDSSHGRGNSLFTWSGSMVMDHRAGRLEIHKGTRSEDQGVRLVHKPLGGGQPMTLDCDALTALFQNSPDGGEKKKDAEQQRLVRALAHGDVTAESEGGIMKLLAEDLDYDAVKSTIDAWAPEDERVTFFDQRHVTPLIARKLHYDLNTGEPFVTEPLPITMPIKRK
jgi:hypothetical protein